MSRLFANKEGHATFVRATHSHDANGDIKSAGEMTI